MGYNRAFWFCLGALSAGVMFAARVGAQPTLKIDDAEKVWDLEKEFPAGIAVGKTAEHEFVVENDGTEPLEITEAKPEGAFLTTALPTEPIAPGKGAPIKAILNTEGLEPGLVETHIVVKSNDAATAAKPLVLTVKARIIPQPETLLVVLPQERDLGLVRVGEPNDVVCTYQNAGTEDVEVFPLHYVDKRLRVVKDIEREVLKPGPKKEFTLVFTAQPGDRNRRIEALFVVKTGSEKEPRVVGRVRAYVAAAGVQMVAEKGPNERGWDMRIFNNTANAVEVVAKRGESEVGKQVVPPWGTRLFPAVAPTEEGLNEIAFTVNLGYKAPEPPEPEGGTTEPAGPATTEGGGTEEPTGGGETAPGGEGG